MSWYLATKNRLLGQFASGQGFSDLRAEIEAGRFPALQEFIDNGVTANIRDCIDQLGQLIQSTRDNDVKVTAMELTRLMRGRRLVLITQGFKGDVRGSHGRPKPAKPAKPAARKARKAVTKRERASFGRRVPKLKTELEKLPADRQEQLRRELEDEGDRER